jgi:hypothetical protein
MQTEQFMQFTTTEVPSPKTQLLPKEISDVATKLMTLGKCNPQTQGKNSTYLFILYFHREKNITWGGRERETETEPVNQMPVCEL